jgi:outer membrane receptor protein involved in Fe transport
MRIIRCLMWGVCAAVLFTLSAAAQNTNTGEIKGSVTDSTGAVIANASVTLTDVLTGVKTHVVTNRDGIYDVPSLLPGEYTIEVSVPGFKDYLRKGVVLQVETIAINASMTVGAATEQVVVTAEAPLLQTENPEQHIIFDQKAVQDAPTVGGIWYNELTNSLPGVNPGGGGSQDSSGQGVGVNGTQGYMANWLIEGSSATQPRDVNASDNYPPIDSISEVQAITGSFGAQYGTGVAAFNVIMKSGANTWHGSAFEFIENDAFDALNYFTPAGSKNPLRWNMYGGSVGGPIKRDKLFFYFTYQRNPAHSSFVYQTTVPTDAMKSGDFSALANPVYDPSTTTCGSYNGTPWCYRSQFQGNKITTGFDSVALAIQKYFPEPNYPDATNPALYNNYRVVVSEPSMSQWYVGKVDYNISPNHKLSGSIMEFPISLYNNVDALCPLGFDCTYAPRNLNQDAQITETWTISPTLLNEFRVGAVRELDKYTPPTYGQGYPTKIGIQPAYGPNAPGDIFPNITINGNDGVGQIGIGGGVHAVLADGAFVEGDILTLVRGRQTIKIGGELDKSYQNYTNWGDVSSGNFQFNGIGTAEFWPNSNYPNTTGGYGTVASGSSYADFLLGQVYGWYVYDYEETGARMWNLAGFFQDDYKVLPHLTLNLGLRYQFQSGWGEVQNRFGSFDPTLTNSATSTLGAMVYGGQNGRNTIENGVHEFTPRIGLAWQPQPNWVVRASYGIFDTPRSAESYTDGALGLGLNPQGSNGYSSNFTTGVSYYPTPWTLQTGPPAGSVIYPVQSDFSNSKYNGQSVYYYPVHMPIEYYQEALLSVQRQFPMHFLVDASYVFTKGTHLNFNRDINQVQEGALGTGNSPYPQFNSIQGAIFDGYSNYNALQLRVEKRMSHSISFLFNYAWSRTLDAGTSNGHYETVDVWQNANDVAANYGPSQLDVPNTINGYATWEIPVGRGRHFALHGVADEALGGWRLTGVYQVHSGIPFTATMGGTDNSGSQAVQCYCGYSWFPNVIGNPKLSHPTINAWFNTAAFATPTTNTFGNERRNMMRGPAWRDLDISVGKTFWIPDRYHLEIRADAFDALNNPNFGQPNSSVGTGVTGGGVISSANSNRLVQLGARFTF